jgi:hypothetical protein
MSIARNRLIAVATLWIGTFVQGLRRAASTRKNASADPGDNHYPDHEDFLPEEGSLMRAMAASLSGKSDACGHPDYDQERLWERRESR